MSAGDVLPVQRIQGVLGVLGNIVLFLVTITIILKKQLKL